MTVTVGRGGHDHAGRAGLRRASLSGIAVPAMPNVHSHAHQRFMLGLAERAGPGADSFWTWREAMYGFALRLSPDDLEAVAAQLYVEMLKAGFSVVGEFQYLHHQPDGTPYADPAEMSLRCLAAAEQAGIGITMLPTLYAFGGFGGQAPVEASAASSTMRSGFSRSTSGCKQSRRAIRCAASAFRRIRCARSRRNCCAR